MRQDLYGFCKEVPKSWARISTTWPNRHCENQPALSTLLNMAPLQVEMEVAAMKVTWRLIGARVLRGVLQNKSHTTKRDKLGRISPEMAYRDYVPLQQEGQSILRGKSRARKGSSRSFIEPELASGMAGCHVRRHIRQYSAEKHAEIWEGDCNARKTYSLFRNQPKKLLIS